MIVFIASSTAVAANEATSFIYPVGNQYAFPTEQSGNANGFAIVQNFNTSSIWEGGGASGGWCESSSGQDNRYQDKATCTAAGENWKYGHTGTDLSNGSCGSEIRATANGVVEYSGSVSGYGNILKIKHVLPNGRIIHSIYGHRDSAMMYAGQVVTKGQLVGYVGNSGNVPCHLHFAIYDDVMPSVNGATIVPAGYLYDDKGTVLAVSNTMRYFYDALLFVDDRNNEQQASLPGVGYWSWTFSNTQSVTTRTAFVVNSSGDAKSLQAAVDAGWIDSNIYWQSGSSWYYYPNQPIESNTLYPYIGQYIFRTLVPNLTFHWFIPGNDYLDARWRQDMMEFATVNSSLGFGRALRETYGNNPSWDTTYGLAVSLFEQTVNGVIRTATVWVAYSKSDPMVRFVSYYNPFTGVYSNWVRVY